MVSLQVLDGGDKFPEKVATQYFRRLGGCRTEEQVENVISDALRSAQVSVSFGSFRDLGEKLHEQYGRDNRWVGRLVLLAVQAHGKCAIVSSQRGNAGIPIVFGLLIQTLLLIGIFTFLTGCAQAADCPEGDEGDCVGGCCIEVVE